MSLHCSRAAAVAAALVALLLAAPSPDTALRQLADPALSSDPTGPLVAVVALLAWAVTVWLVLTVAAVLLSRLPGLVGATCAVVARCVAPALVRRTVEGALGLTVAVGVLAPSTALATAAPGPAADPGPVAEATWDLDWPTGDPAPGTVGAAPTPSAAASSAPSTPSDATAPPAPPAPAADPLPVPSSTPPAAARPSPVVPAPAAAVVVRAGDSLWSLAEASLRRAGTSEPTDRQVAQAWPRWWAANREVVGDDPDLLLPGTVLRAPR